VVNPHSDVFNKKLERKSFPDWEVRISAADISIQARFQFITLDPKGRIFYYKNGIIQESGYGEQRRKPRPSGRVGCQGNH